MKFKPVHNEKFYYLSLGDFVVRSWKYDSFDYFEQVDMRYFIKNNLVFKTMKDARSKLRQIKNILKNN